MGDERRSPCVHCWTAKKSSDAAPQGTDGPLAELYKDWPSLLGEAGDGGMRGPRRG